MIIGALLWAAAPPPDHAKSANGALGLVFVLILGVAVAFLLRSMNKHLRKAQRMKLDDEQAATGNVDLTKQP